MLRMLETDKPVKIHAKFTTPQMMRTNLDMMCLPAAGRLIQGAGWIIIINNLVNSFAYMGLSELHLQYQSNGMRKEAKKWKAA